MQSKKKVANLVMGCQDTVMAASLSQPDTNLSDSVQPNKEACSRLLSRHTLIVANTATYLCCPENSYTALAANREKELVHASSDKPHCCLSVTHYTPMPSKS
uniref:Uncharacterized protein n=1 Tax=Dunaliella tertiolecta TaxID=3047 RepID=A0A7S3VUN9_DUNTE|eukprot:1144421-Pelagomonas_calceolata.AAC.2